MTNPQTEKRKEKVIKFVGNAESKVILDIGVNNFRLSDKIKAKKILKLDVVKEANPDIICDLNYDSIPLKENSVDIVIAGEVLEHLNNPFRVAREFHRILTPGGVCIITVPNVCSLVNRVRFLFGKLPGHCAIAWDSKLLQDPEKHQNDFNLESIKNVLSKAKFKIEKVDSNGIVTHSKILPIKSPASFGEVLIVKARKAGKRK